MNDRDVRDELNQLLRTTNDETVDTSVRLRASLRDAAALAVDAFDAAPSVDTMVANAVRQALETLAFETALRLHHTEQPAGKPTLAEVALALAAQDGSPLASHPELISAAADAVLERRPDADADDVLLWAEAQLAVSIDELLAGERARDQTPMQPRPFVPVDDALRAFEGARPMSYPTLRDDLDGDDRTSDA